MLKVDIDYEDDWESEYKLLKCRYAFSWIKREIIETWHGYHVIMDCQTSDGARLYMGDDPNRVYMDNYYKYHPYTDLLFTVKKQIKITKSGGIQFKTISREAVSNTHLGHSNAP